VKYVGLDWAYRTAQWCALAPGGEIAGEGRIAADRDGLARLVFELGDEVQACLEQMSKWPFLLLRRPTTVARASLNLSPSSVPKMSGARRTSSPRTTPPGC
jgi:hypothetical protein